MTTYTTSTSNNYWVGDPIPNDWTTTPMIPGHIEYYPYIQTWPTEIQKDNTEELKRFIEKALKEKDETKTKEEEDLMRVFEVTVIDRRECEILHEQKVIAKDKETAMLELDLTPDVRKKVRKNLVEFIFNEIGSFTKAERKIKVKDLEEDED